ncbi:MAG: hypothetical protein ACREI6_02275 [Candidatus Rokuibacteriota bacterium]
MSVSDLGMRSSAWAGAHLYDRVGYAPLVLIAAACTAAWLLVPLVPIDAIQAAAREAAQESARSTVCRADS